MKIQKIFVKVGATQSMGDYSNMKFEFAAEADLLHDEDATIELKDLCFHLSREVYTAIDEALEKRGEPAKFSDDPRCDAYWYPDERACIILQEGEEEPAGYHSYWRGHRFDSLKRILKKAHPECPTYTHDPGIVKQNYIEIKDADHDIHCFLVGFEDIDDYLVIYPFLKPFRLRENYKFMTWATFKSWLISKVAYVSGMGNPIIDLSKDGWEENQYIQLIKSEYEKRMEKLDSEPEQNDTLCDDDEEYEEEDE